MKAKLERFVSILHYCLQLEPRILYDGIAAAVLKALEPFVMLIISKVLIEAVLVKTDYVVLLRQILLLLAARFLLSLCGGGLEKRYNYYFKKFLCKHDMCKASHLLEIPYTWTEEDSMQELLAEILNLETKNVFSFRSFSTHVNQASASLVALLLAIFLTAGIFTKGAALGRIPARWLDFGFILLFGLLFFLTLKIVAWINAQFGKVLGQNASPLLRYLKAYNALIYQYRSGKDIRLFSKELAEEYTNLYRTFSEKIFSMLSSLFTRNISIETTMASLSNGIIYFFIAIKALNGSIRISEIILFIGAFSQLTHYAIELIDSISMIKAGDLYREKILHYYSLGKETKILTDTAQTTPLPAAALSCRVEKLSFAYPGSEKQVLQDISFSLAPGEKLAIVGENGSGKTTLIKLLLGFYKQYDGDIFLAGRNSKDMPAETMGNLFAPVFQDFKLLAFTLKDNVSCFTEAADTQIQDTLTQVGLRDFYNAHGPNVYLSRSLEGAGVEISGGEAQKIALARAMLKTSPIFILDEPTAALDPVSERDIYEKFNEIIRGKTAVFISHRLSSCKFCDRILVMDKGRLVQMGSHEELLQNAQGKYRELWTAQSQHYLQ